MARKYKRDKNGRFAGGSSLSDRLSRYDTYKRVAGYAGAAAGLAAAGYVGHKALTSRQIKVSEVGRRPVAVVLGGAKDAPRLPAAKPPEAPKRPPRQPKDTKPTFWRIQDAGLPLSKSHRSRTWSEDSDDEGEIHKATSAVRSIRDLARANPSLGMGAVELIKFEGDEVGKGWDGEPVVKPSKELLRFRLPKHRGVSSLKLSGAKTVRDLLNAGWSEVESLEVKD